MIIDTKEFISSLLSELDAGNSFMLPVSGLSMAPFLIGGRDTVELRKADQKIKKGDIALYRRSDGSYVLHRLIRTDDFGFYFCGDNQTALEGPVGNSQVLAVVTCVNRNGCLIGQHSLIWRFYASFWRVMRPLRPFAARISKLFRKN